MFCYYCNQEIRYDRWCDFLRYHVHKLHNVDINLKEYYDKFLKKENEGFCKTCGKPTNFQDMNNGYSKYCSQKCVNADPEITKIQKEKRKQYFENLSKEETQNRSNKLKEKWKERDVNSMVDKIKLTKLERYGDENYNNR